MALQCHTLLRSIMIPIRQLARSPQGCTCTSQLTSARLKSSSHSDKSTLSHLAKKYKEYVTPSPYKPLDHPVRTMDYKQKHFDGGPLPRIAEDLKALPEYKPKDPWTREKALFGENDYIDIFGDGSVHPVQTMEGPRWLVGFRGNEYQRTLRRLKYNGHYIAGVRPKQFADLNKRLRFLYKKHNQSRSSGCRPHKSV